MASDWSTKTVSGRTRPEAWRVVVGQQPMKRLAVVMADSDIGLLSIPFELQNLKAASTASNYPDMTEKPPSVLHCNYSDTP